MQRSEVLSLARQTCYGMCGLGLALSLALVCPDLDLGLALVMYWTTGMHAVLGFGLT